MGAWSITEMYLMKNFEKDVKGFWRGYIFVKKRYIGDFRWSGIKESGPHYKWRDMNGRKDGMTKDTKDTKV